MPVSQSRIRLQLPSTSLPPSAAISDNALIDERTTHRGEPEVGMVGATSDDAITITPILAAGHESQGSGRGQHVDVEHYFGSNDAVGASSDQPSSGIEGRGSPVFQGGSVVGSGGGRWGLTGGGAKSEGARFGNVEISSDGIIGQGPYTDCPVLRAPGAVF